MTEPFYRLPADLAEDIDTYEQEVQSFLAGEMPAGVLKAKRVPRGVYEQRTNGTYMVRVRIAGGTLSREQMEELAAIAERYGNGMLHVTTRQDVQIHDVSIENTPAIMRRLMDTGLTSKGGGGNTVRNVTACPYAGICPHEQFDVTPFTHAVTEYLIPLLGSYNLPRKYKIAFSGCAADCALGQIADLGFIASIKNARPGFRLFAGGGMGAHSRVADEFNEWVPAKDVVRIAEAMRRLFDKFGNRGNKHKARLRFVFENLGIDRVRNEFEKCLHEVEADPVPEWKGTVVPNRTAQDTGPHTPQLQLLEGVRCFRQHQPGYLAVPLHLPLGFLSARKFVAIADVAREFSDEAGCRTARSQNVIIRFVPENKLALLAGKLREINADLLSFDPLEKFVACAGASTCRLGLCLARGAAQASAEYLRKHQTDPGTLNATNIFINGCPNACGQQPVAPLGFFGAAQRVKGKLVPCYRVTVGGRCNQWGARLGTSVGQIPAKAMPSFLGNLTRDFQRERNGDESFLSYVDRMGSCHFEQIATKHAEVPEYSENPEYYRDFGMDKDFSLAGRGAGECGAGVFDVIRNDLTAAKKAEEPFETVLPAARALLITRGVDARQPDKVFREFEKHFIDTGLVPDKFRELLTRARGYLQGWEQALDGYQNMVNELLERVELLNSTLDASLQFHPPESATGTEHSQGAPVTHKPPGTAGEDGKPHAGSSAELDLRGVACPMNFVKAKLRLENMDKGQSLAIIVDDGEPAQNVPASFRNEGHTVQETVDLGHGHWKVVVRKEK
jgi:sulfite reductase (ferredoxin)